MISRFDPSLVQEWKDSSSLSISTMAMIRMKEAQQSMRILLTNDDGIEADGLLSLADALSSHAEISIVAPERGCSCCGHSLTHDRSARNP